MSKTLDPGRRRAQWAADAYVVALDNVDCSAWLAYILEAIEARHGLDALTKVQGLIEERLHNGRW